jgi:hypothetical protein
MTKEERAPYEQIPAEAKDKYMGEMEVYKQKKAEEASSASKEEEELRKLEREQGLQLLRKKEWGYSDDPGTGHSKNDQAEQIEYPDFERVDLSDSEGETHSDVDHAGGSSSVSTSLAKREC